jgi:hypothetical protein
MYGRLYYGKRRQQPVQLGVCSRSLFAPVAGPNFGVDFECWVLALHCNRAVQLSSVVTDPFSQFAPSRVLAAAAAVWPVAATPLSR